jgi:hypothetical protein
MKVHIGADAESGRVHKVIATPANTSDVKQRCRGEETVAFGDAGYQGVEKRGESKLENWHVAMRPGKRKKLDLVNPIHAIGNEIERLKASVREGRTPVSGDQAPVRLCEGTLPRPCEERGANHDAVCVGECPNGEAKTDSEGVMSGSDAADSCAMGNETHANHRMLLRLRGSTTARSSELGAKLLC